MKPDGRNIETVVEGIWDLEGNEQESAPHEVLGRIQACRDSGDTQYQRQYGEKHLQEKPQTAQAQLFRNSREGR